MKNFISDFENKLIELNKYFEFITFIDKIETHKKDYLSIESKGQSISRIQIDRDLQKILRSNSFLLLYNLIESSIRNSIIAVYDAIHDESLSYKDLSNKLQEVWLKHKSKQFLDSKKTFRHWLKEAMNNAISDNIIILEKDSIDISGNLDYSNIQKIVETYGLFGQISGDKNEIKKSIDRVKRERNLLAHGNKTFCQSGEIVTINELIQTKSIIVIYLKELLQNTENFINNKRYKK